MGKFGMMAGCPKRASPVGWRIRTRFPVSILWHTYRESSVIRRRGSLLWCGGEKNTLRHVWYGALDLVRPSTATRPGSVVRRLSNLPRCRGTAGLLPPLWRREAREAGVSVGECAAHAALRALCGATLSQRYDQGCGRGAASGLAHGQASGEAIHA